MENWLEELYSTYFEKGFVIRYDKDRSTPIFIYGTGRFAKDIQLSLAHRETNFIGFLDFRCNSREKINRMPVFNPNDPKISTLIRKSAIILLGIHNREANPVSISNDLAELGYEGKILSSVEYYEEFESDLGSRFWLAPPVFYKNNFQEIENAYNCLSDQTSRDIYEALIKFRITGNFNFLPIPDLENQYHPDDLPRWNQPLNFIDCGAYNGNTVDELLNAGYQFDTIAGFEPDPTNFHSLIKYISGKTEIINQVYIYPCGVHSETKMYNFYSGDGEASTITSEGNSLVQCVSLDECLPNMRPTLIKMDIEGSELQALKGAKGTIMKHSPALAISIYHSPSHIWEIPLYIIKTANDGNLKYTFHIRSHGYNGFDTIFYAVPVVRDNI